MGSFFGFIAFVGMIYFGILWGYLETKEKEENEKIKKKLKAAEEEARVRKLIKNMEILRKDLEESFYMPYSPEKGEQIYEKTKKLQKMEKELLESLSDPYFLKK